MHHKYNFIMALLLSASGSSVKHKNTIILSPFLLILINYIVAVYFGKSIGKWAFIPIILIEWCFFSFLIYKHGGMGLVRSWLGKSRGSFGWNILALIIGIIPIPVFVFHVNLLATCTIWLPWILIAVINPWMEEFYWRGLLSDATGHWKGWLSVLFSGTLFAANHLIFGVNSLLFRGPAVLISTLVMGLVWAVVYKKTHSLRWVILAHFLVDFFNLSVPSFLDLYKAGR